MTRQTRRAFVATVGTLGFAGCSSLAENAPLPIDTEDEQETRRADKSTAPRKIADDFEDLSYWQAVERQGDLSKSTNAYQGSQCAHVVGSGKTKEGHIIRSVSGADLRGTNFSMAVKSLNHDFFKIAIELHAPDGDHTVQLKRTLLGPKNRWVRVNFGVTGVKKGVDRSSVEKLRIVARPVDTNAKEPIEFLVDDLRTTSRPETGSVMFTFDDSHSSHYRAYELMKKYGFSGVEGVIPESIGRDDRLTENQLATMADDGWDIAAHPNVQASYFSDYAPDEQERLMTKTRDFLRDSGFEDGARHLLVPKNVLGPETFDLAREHYDTVFSFGGGPNAMPLVQDDTIVSRVNGKNVAETKQFIDYASDYGQLVVPLFHEVGNDISERDFESLLQYVETKDVNVVTASDLLDG
ncbi:Polysaccharide deacetylase [Haladaptatus litoreus]|uniref:Polysaccharide deacetylase n=1 Tax=Haladaptatus litoreus TaxID=553468 RepID=A0A1N6WF02_9EURY|nr:polysaccharide deacetylase family protein [Haladaptatus litoreus]SIQ88701.1 Polysaccharide deacetylase [Haladaptatus litoreus]